MSDTTPARGSLEQALADRGFVRVPGMGYLAWRGTIGGRTCTVSVSPITRTTYPMDFRRRVTVGYRLAVELVTTVRIRLFFMRTRTAGNILMRGLHRLGGMAAILPASVPPGYCVVTNDTAWAERLSQHPPAMATVAALIGAPESPEAGASVYFRAGSATGWACYGSPTSTRTDVDGAELDHIFARLSALVDAAEGLPAPTPLRLGRWGRFTEQNPQLGVLAVFMGAIALAGLGVLMLVGLLILVAWLNTSR